MCENSDGSSNIKQRKDNREDHVNTQTSQSQKQITGYQEKRTMGITMISRKLKRQKVLLFFHAL